MNIAVWVLRWADDENIHCVPIGDAVGHEEKPDCVCGPAYSAPTERRPEHMYRHHMLRS